jgi:ABC-type transporter MlaC component
MRKILILLTLQLFFIAKAFSFNVLCEEAGENIEIFLNASIGRMVSITNNKATKERKSEEMYEVIKSCIDVTKVAKRVIGRAKWQELTESEQENFIKEYPKYFIGVFRDIILASMTGTKEYTYKPGKAENSFDVTFVSHKSPANNFTINLLLDKKDGHYVIVDGKFAEISVLQSQKNMFDRLYDTDKQVIKNFKAEYYIKK